MNISHSKIEYICVNERMARRTVRLQSGKGHEFKFLG